jgi:hypothetical protein
MVSHAFETLFSRWFIRKENFSLSKKREREAMSEKRRWQQLLSNRGDGRSCFI